MNVHITDAHIYEVADTLNYKITNISKLINFIENAMDDEVREDGATSLCIFIENLLNQARDEDAGIIYNVLTGEKFPTLNEPKIGKRRELRTRVFLGSTTEEVETKWNDFLVAEHICPGNYVDFDLVKLGSVYQLIFLYAILVDIKGWIK